MWFRSALKSVRSRRSLADVRPLFRRPRSRLLVEALEDRSLLSCTVSLATSDSDLVVGERATWTATAADCGVAPVYQFSVAPHDSDLQVVRDFSPRL
jgi:hypothetical protein